MCFRFRAQTEDGESMPYVIRNIQVSVNVGGSSQFLLIWMSAGTFDFLLDLSEDLEDREYCARFIHHQLIEPKLDIETVRSLPDKTLVKIARTWARDDKGLGQALPRNGRVFSTFKAALINYKSRQSERASQTIRSISSSFDDVARSAMRSYSALSGVSRQWRGIEHLRSSTEFARALNQIRPPSQVYQLAAHLEGLNLSAAYVSLDKSLALGAFSSINKTLSEISRAISTMPVFSLPMRDLLASIEVGKLWTDQVNANLSLLIKEINSNAAIASANVPALLNNAFRASDAFSKYYDDVLLATQASTDATLTRASLILPPLTTAVTLGTVYKVGFRGSDLSDSKAIDEGIAAAQTEGTYDIEFYLSQVDPRFVAKWNGCIMTMQSDNPDKISQVAHAGRELLSQLLHTLAPDDRFSPEEFKLHKVEGSKPTRKMRVAKYLGVKADAKLVVLVEAQAKVFDALYNVLSDAAHDHQDKYSTTTIGGFIQALAGVIVALLSSKIEPPHD